MLGAMDLGILWSSATALSVWQPGWVGRNQQERSQAEAHIGAETINSDRSAATNFVILRMARYYVSLKEFSTAILSGFLPFVPFERTACPDCACLRLGSIAINTPIDLRES
jgi:hypothetical protein